MQNYTFYEDPGHGWLEVPLKELIELGIANAISHFSYVKIKQGTPFVYLEEDCDYSTFADAMAKAGKQYKCESVYQENCSVRNLPSYHPADWHL
jgi:hypothetical protein